MLTARGIGVIVLVCFLTRAVERVWLGDAANLLWACHSGALIVAVGLLTKQQRVTQLGVLWMCLGNLLWGMSLLAGDSFVWTTILTHFGGLFGGLWGVSALGGWRAYRLLWLWAMLAGQVQIQLSRWLTPPADNINLAFFIQPGWEEVFGHSMVAYHLFLAAFSSALFFVCGRVFRRVVPVAKKNASG